MKRKMFTAILALMISDPGLSLDNASDGKIEFLKVGKSVSQGGRTYIQNPEISLELPAGWTAMHAPNNGTTLLLENKAQRVRVGKDIYRAKPTISIKTIYQSEPIDEVRIKSFIEELNDFYGKKLQSFQVVQQERIDFAGSKDALLVYSSYYIGDLPMIQMHFLVASDKEQYVVTYTDAETLFTNNAAKQDLAWSIVTSIDFDGKPAGRFAKLQGYGIIAGSIMGFLMIFRFMRKFKHRRILKKQADDDLSEDLISKSGEEDEYGLVSLRGERGSLRRDFSHMQMEQKSGNHEPSLGIDDYFEDEIDPADFDDFQEDPQLEENKKSSNHKSRVSKQELESFEDLDIDEDLPDLGEDLDDDDWAL